MSAFTDLARALGIHESYSDFGGHEVFAGEEVLRALVRAMLPEIGSEGDAAGMLRQRREEAETRIAPREIVLRAGAPADIALKRPENWHIRTVGGHVLAEGRAEAAAGMPPLPAGVHELVLTGTREAQSCWLLATPGPAPSLAGLTGRGRCWGVTTALYGIVSRRNAGLGDYRDLGDAAASMARHGADFVGINPVHVLGSTPPDGLISPYSPSHRAFLNPWHIALDDLERFGGAPGAPAHARDGAGLVDYARVAAIREPALRRAFARFLELPPEAAARRDFDTFERAAGPQLRDFAVFEALSAEHGPDWPDWPANLRNARSRAVAAFARRRPDEVRYHAWLQWVADTQMGRAQGRARGAGMGLGLYLDFAVGPRPGGAETWTGAHAHVRGATLGAPPDLLSSRTQGWGLAPFNPAGLAASGYVEFARLLRGAMRHAGMIRIDHALGLLRSYLIPDGADHGAYVSYPLDALLAVIAMESARSGALVVGEDLGLVPEGFRARLAEAGLYGLDIMQYEREPGGAFRPTQGYRSQGMAAFGTHDTPTLAGFFSARDAELQHRLGRIGPGDLDAVRADRAAMAGDDAPAALRDRVHGALANAASELVAVQLDDVTGETEQQNVPGTIHEYPNWRRRTALPVEEMADNAELAGLGRMMAAAGRSNADLKEELTT